MNSHGTLFRITTFGESHGVALGVIIDGLPSGFVIDEDNMRHELARRATGQSTITSARKEAEEFEFLSGIFEGRTTGHPIAILIRNTNAHSKDYSNLKDLFRPNHADLTYHKKWGHRDYRGGGRSSARETVARVLAGAIAKQFLHEKLGTKIYAHVKQVGDIRAEKVQLDQIENNIVRTADPDVAEAMIKKIQDTAANGDSIGGILECITLNPPAFVGEPQFDKAKARLAGSMLSIGGVLGFEYGAGFSVGDYTGKIYNQGFQQSDGKIHSQDNRYGGMLGGITTGEDLIFRIALKPTSSLVGTTQQTVTTEGEETEFTLVGRHDPCLCPRAVAIIESMVAIDLLDLYLIHNARQV